MKRINERAPVICNKSITINADIRKVWMVLVSINKWPNWQKEIVFTRQYGFLAPQTKFDWKIGRAFIRSTIHTIVPYQAFGWTGRMMGTFAIHNWRLKEENGSTIIDVEESIEGFWAFLLKPFFKHALEKGISNWLIFLKQTCEQQNIYTY